MGKKTKKDSLAETLPQQEHVLAFATARRFDGGAVELIFVFQPADAGKVFDQFAHSLVPKRKR